MCYGQMESCDTKKPRDTLLDFIKAASNKGTVFSGFPSLNSMRDTLLIFDKYFTNQFSI